MSDVKFCVGIDVSGAVLDYGCWPDGPKGQCVNNEEGISRLVDICGRLGPDLIVMEASGGLEMPLAAGLQDAGLPVFVANPKRVRDFIRSTGQLAKTDRIDPAGIAHYASQTHVEARSVPDAGQRKLKALVTRRNQIRDQITAEKSRLARTAQPDARRDIRDHLRWLEGRLKKMEKRIADHIKADAEMSRKKAILQSVPGVAEATSNSILSEMPELGQLDRKKITALAGLAPFARDSGTFKGKRTIGGGRAALRRALYMAALVATRHNPVIMRQYRRLTDMGKQKKTALVACMRKLLLILNNMLRNNSKWNQFLPQNP